MPSLNAGDTLDHYRIDAVIAHTQMSVLYKATDLTPAGSWPSRFPLRKWKPTQFSSNVSNEKKKSAASLTTLAS